MTVYAQALMNPQAHEALREYEDFELVRQIIQSGDLPQRVRRQINSVKTMIDEVSVMRDVEAELPDAANQLEQVSASLASIVNGKPVRLPA